MSDRFLWLSLSILLTCSCGSGGGSEKDGDDDDSSTVVTPSGPSQVVAKFYLGDTTKPALNYSLWLLDHTDRKVVRRKLDNQGAVGLDLDVFKTGNTYSMHLFDPDFLSIGVLDMSAGVPDVQSAILYEGGIGFDLGEIVLNMTTRGTVDLDDTNLVATVGGGFSVQIGVSGALAAYPLPSIIESLEVASELVVFNPMDLLHSFYLRSSNQELYSRDLQKYSGIHVTYDGAAGVKKISLSIDETGDWRKASRLAANVGADPDKSPYWSLRNLSIPDATSTKGEAHAYVGRFLNANDALILRIDAGSAGIEHHPALLGTVVGVPAVVSGISLSGGNPATISYSSATGENGLTRPFCLSSSDVVLALDRPLDEDGTAIGQTLLNQVKVQFAYYKIENDQDTVLTPGMSDYPTAYQEVVSDSSLTDITRVWTPADRALLFRLGDTAGAASTVSLTLWNELFLSAVGDDSIKKVLLQIFFRHSSGALQSGIPIWFALDC